jgi:hypothetical protein
MRFAGRCGGGRLSKTDRLLMGWWVFTALTHIVFETPFLFTPDFLSKENPNFFDETCEFSGAATIRLDPRSLCQLASRSFEIRYSVLLLIFLWSCIIV